ncbi:MAG: dGTPase [Alphaproteobacteria bacterium]|jgi:dGTPase
MTKPENIMHFNESKLAPYATDWRESVGRIYPEPEAFDRSPFQRDRDRIIHSEAFRRLQYKTQVYANQNAGDHFRTRLTHSMEVAQITRDICRYLNLDEDLGECIALAHDLGHPPFGHAGEDALHKCMEPYGGYRHNDQTLRVVLKLERRYAPFDGLNLTWESREGIAKHNGPIKNADEDLYDGLDPRTHCGLEGQVAAMADDIAYNHHDIDDGIGMGNLNIKDMCTVPHFKRMYEEVVATYPGVEEYRLLKETLRRLISKQIKDLLMTSKTNLTKSGVKNVAEVRAYGKPLIGFSKKVEQQTVELKHFLYNNMYRHFKVNRSAFRAHRIIGDLFEVHMKHRRMLPAHVQEFLPKDKEDKTGKAKVVADYISSLTDRSCVQEHARLFGIR